MAWPWERQVPELEAEQLVRDLGGQCRPRRVPDADATPAETARGMAMLTKRVG